MKPTEYILKIRMNAKGETRRINFGGSCVCFLARLLKKHILCSILSTYVAEINSLICIGLKYLRRDKMHVYYCVFESFLLQFFSILTFDFFSNDNTSLYTQNDTCGLLS